MSSNRCWKSSNCDEIPREAFAECPFSWGVGLKRVVRVMVYSSDDCRSVVVANVLCKVWSFKAVSV